MNAFTLRLVVEAAVLVCLALAPIVIVAVTRRDSDE